MKCIYTNCWLWELNKEECDDCVDGRYMPEINNYASTCDGCGELTLYELMTMDEKTHLSYCEKCINKK